MKAYFVEVTETLSRIIKVSAKDENEALEIVQNEYDEEIHLLDYNDYIDTEIKIVY
jgi:cell division protein FtsB